MLVMAVERRDSGRGGFVTLLLGNSRGRLPTSPFWPADQPRLAGHRARRRRAGSGEIGQYQRAAAAQGHSHPALPAGAVDWRRLLPSVDDGDALLGALDRWRRAIRGPRLRRTLDLFYRRRGLPRALRGRVPPAPPDTTPSSAACSGIPARWPPSGVPSPRSAGADATSCSPAPCFTTSASSRPTAGSGAFETTDAGALLGHVTLGMLMLDRPPPPAAPAPPCTADELTPAPAPDRVAPRQPGVRRGGRRPMTLEAEILHFADNASAKTTSMANALADADNFPAGARLSARSLWQLDRRRVYRGRSDWGRGRRQRGRKTERPPSRG